MKYFVLVVALVSLTFAQEPRKISDDVHRPNIVQKSEPTYTEEAREARLEGTVTLNITIDVNGAVKDIKVIKGLGLGLDEKAMKAIATWKFQPARLKKDNSPVAVTAAVEMNFRLI